MWLVGILGLFLLTASVTALLARREQQPPNIHWEVVGLGEAYAGIVSDLAAFSVTAAVFLADIQTEAKQSLADVMAMFIISFIILMGTTVTYTTFSGVSSPEEMIEDFQLGRRVMYIFSTLGFYLGLSTGWLGLHPLLMAINLQEVANVLIWILLAALFGGSSRLGAWLHTLLGVNLLTTSLLSFIAFAAAALYKLVLVPRYPELWPTTHTALSLTALVFAVGFPIFALDTLMIARHGNQKAYIALQWVGSKILPSYIACASTSVFLLWFAVIAQHPVQETTPEEITPNESGQHLDSFPIARSRASVCLRRCLPLSLDG
jgi:hypothetical protein